MKVTFTPPAGATLKGRTADNKEVTLESVTVEPFFSLKTGFGEVLHGQSKSKGGAVLDAFAMVASGRNGRVTRRENKPVIPLVDMQDASEQETAK